MMKWIPLNSKLDGECGIVEVAGKKNKLIVREGRVGIVGWGAGGEKN